MSARAAAVWMDHKEARVFRVEHGDVAESKLRAPNRHEHRHPKGGTAEALHPDDQHRFFADVAAALEGLERILLVGPSTAKVQFMRHLERQEPRVAAHIVGTETTDHPTDAELSAYVRRHFGLADRIR